MKLHFYVPLAALALALAGCGKTADDKAAAAPASVPPTQVVAVEAKVQPVAETLFLVGTLAADESVEVKAEIDGVVQEIMFEEGQRIEKGKLLVKLDDTKLAAAVTEGEANFKLSKANFERAQQLFKDKLISQQEFDQSSATFAVNEAGLDLKRRQLKDTRIYAPFGGMISSRSISPGQVITKSTTLTWIIDLDPMKAEVNVPERFLGQLKVGQTVEFKVAAFGGRSFQGQVYFIAPFVEAASRTAQVKALIPNKDFQLKPGMFANLDLTLTMRDKAIVIPESAIMLSGDRTSVLVVDKNQTAQLRAVKLGVRQAGVVEIVSGLEGGELVITEGLQKTRPGGPVKVIAPSAPAPGESKGEPAAPKS